MADFVTLSCPTCNGKLQITNDIDRFVCSFCGNEHLIIRSGGIIAAKAIENGIKNIQVNTDKTASELAIIRLSDEIPEAEREITRFTQTTRSNYNTIFFRQYEILTKKFGANSFETIISELDKDFQRRRAAIDEVRDKPIVRAIKDLLVIIDSESSLKNYENDLTNFKALVSELRLKQSQLDEHKKIVERM